MRKIIKTLYPIVIALIIVSCGPTTQDAIKYSETIIDKQIAIVKTIDILDESFNHFDIKDTEKTRIEALNTTNNAIEAITKMENFEKECVFKNEALILFNTYKSILEDEYVKIIELYNLPQEEYTMVEDNMWNEISKKLTKKKDSSFNKFNEQHLLFAQKYKFELISPEDI
jgi:hypothetical protein